MNQLPLSELPVAVDVMGGDHGSIVITEGAIQAVKELGIAVCLIGKQEEITPVLEKHGVLNHPKISVLHAEEVITMDDTPSRAIRQKQNASIRKAFELARDGKASAVVSPGNTGAMMAAGLFISGVIEGIARPAIATLIPKVGDFTPTVLLDSGANIQCNAEQIVQFAIMGQFYAKAILNLDSPRIALLSNGTEPSKGNDLIRAAAYILSKQKDLNYVGYVEGKHFPDDCADVVVCDGFTGNVVLKTMEGSVELVVDSIKHYISKSWRGKLGMLLAKPVFKKLFHEKLDPQAYGGAPLLGLKSVGIVCHGSSKQKAIFNAVRVAKKLSDSNLIEKMQKALTAIEIENEDGNYEDGIWGRMGQKFENQKKKTQEIKDDKTT